MITWFSQYLNLLVLKEDRVERGVNSLDSTPQRFKVRDRGDSFRRKGKHSTNLVVMVEIALNGSYHV